MDEKKLVHKPHASGDPVKAKPNTRREKTYQPPNSPDDVRKAREDTPIREAEDRVEDDMSKATDEVKKQIE